MHIELMILLALSVPDPSPELPSLWELDRFPGMEVADRHDCCEEMLRAAADRLEASVIKECDWCAGRGGVYDSFGEYESACSHCGGTGKASVKPGEPSREDADRLHDIKRRLYAATKGPWTYIVGYGFGRGGQGAIRIDGDG